MSVSLAPAKRTSSSSKGNPVTLHFGLSYRTNWEMGAHLSQPAAINVRIAVCT